MKIRLWSYRLKKRFKERKLKRVQDLQTDRNILAHKDAIMGSRGEQDFDQAGVGKSNNSMGPN